MFELQSSAQDFFIKELLIDHLDSKVNKTRIFFADPFLFNFF